MNNTQCSINIEEAKVDPIASASPFMFVVSCMMLAYTNAVPLSTYPSPWLEVAQPLYSASQVMWLAAAMSIVMMFILGLPPIRNQLSALVVGLVGSIVILIMAGFQISWLVMMVLLFAVLIPAGNVAFCKMTVTPSKSQL